MKAVGEIMSIGRTFEESLGKMCIRDRPEAIVCHPGPVNRGVELDDYMCDNPQRSVILDQVYSCLLYTSASR